MSVYLKDADVTLHHGDVLDVLRSLDPESVDCVVTSPPYFGLRDYGMDGQIGLELTLEDYVAGLVAVFGEIRRVLAPHATVWCNLGDSFEDKQLAGVPWRVAFALQADGWWLRSDIVWAKPNPMPESVTDRPTKAHEYVFLLTKQPKYFFDQEAVREPAEYGRRNWSDAEAVLAAATNGYDTRENHGVRAKASVTGGDPSAGRNVRSVWTIATQPYPEAHFATYPQELVRRCVLAGCPERVCRVCGKPSERIVEANYTVTPGRGPTGVHNRPREGDVGYRPTTLLNRHNTTLGWSDCGHNAWRPGRVLDPFVGSGTSCKVARDHGRHSVGIDLNSTYLELAARRLQQQSLFSEGAVSPTTEAV